MSLFIIPIINADAPPNGNKLAYICNSTGAPIAYLFPFGGASAFIMGIINSDIDNGTLKGNAFSYLISALPFQFYTWLVILSVPAFIFIFKDFGPMKKSYIETTEDNIKDFEDLGSKGYKNKEIDKGRLDFMILPLATLITTIISIIYYTGHGVLANGDTSLGIYFGSIITIVFTGFYIIATSKVKLEEFVKWSQEGMKNMLPTITVLILASTLGANMEKLNTGYYLSQLISNNINLAFIPVCIFLIACVISFSTGSSSATIMIILPLIIPIAVTTHLFLPLVIGAVISGSIFGDQSSPISDSVIVASLASSCEVVDHFKTQLPYTLSIAGISILLFSVLGFILN